MNGIQVENLVKTYSRGKVRALDGVSLTIPSGGVFGVIGPNGAGKTTLMGCLMGFLNPDSGSIHVDGMDVEDIRVRLLTGFVPERLTFEKWMSGRSFTAYQHALAKLPAPQRDQEVVAALTEVGLEETAWDRPLAKYSRGMLQRLALAQAILGSPRYLFLDEPTSGMDPLGVMAVKNLLAKLKKQGCTIILNSHQLEQVDQICDQVVFVRQGRVEAMETQRAGEAVERSLAVSWRKLEKGLSEAQLKAIIEPSGAQLKDFKEGQAEFLIKDDQGSEKLLACLIQANIPVIEAHSVEKRLERLFMKENDTEAKS
jgi:ABC-2 type transport system ATP-binding protein